MASAEPILWVSAPRRGRAFAAKWRGMQPAFWCALGHTDTCFVPGISSAGISEALRQFTPAADAEVVTLGAAMCLPRLPSHPLGAPGPAGITRAALCMAAIEPHFVGAGLRAWPDAPCTRAGERPGAPIDGGQAVPDARDLYQTGLKLGAEIGASAPYLVLGESVPGGTTTALAVLLALGYAAEGRVSGSSPGNAHLLKTSLARAALTAAQLGGGAARGDPLRIISAVGDPMQPLAVGMGLGASRAGCDVLLAGGSQMVAVAALMQALEGPAALARVAIGTTRWIVEDPSADVAGLARDVAPDLAVLAVNLDFERSRHTGLRAYEDFMVKEGVGAGGACLAALLATGAPLERLHACIDAAYDGLLGRLTER